MTSEDHERSNPRWLQATASNVQTSLILEPERRKTFTVSFPTKLGMPIHLVILMRSPVPKDMHLDQGQGQGQITLKTFGHYFA